MYLYYDRNGVLKEIINDAPLRQASEENKIYIYFAPNAEGVEEGSSCSLVVERPDKTTYLFATPTHIYTPTSSRETTPSECYIPVSKKRDLKYFSEFKAYKFYEFDLTSDVLTLNGTYNFTAKMYQGTSEIQQLQITPFFVEDAVIADYKSIDISMFNYLISQLQGKHVVLTAGYGITIEGNIISVDTNDIATKQDLNSKQDTITDITELELYSVKAADTGSVTLTGDTLYGKAGIEYSRGLSGFITALVSSDDLEENVCLTFPAKSGTLATLDDVGGNVTSVNEQTGDVVLTASDIYVTNSQSVQANLERIDGEVEDVIDTLATKPSLYLHSIKVNYESEPSLFFISTQETTFTFDNTNKCINISKPVLSCYYYNFGVFRSGFTMSITNDLSVSKNTIKFVYYIDEATDEIFKKTFSSVSQINDSVSEL